jgi:hypothetical protein
MIFRSIDQTTKATLSFIIVNLTMHFGLSGLICYFIFFFCLFEKNSNFTSGQFFKNDYGKCSIMENVRLKHLNFEKCTILKNIRIFKKLIFEKYPYF